MKEQKKTLPKFIDDGRLDKLIEILNYLRYGNQSIFLDFNRVEGISPAGMAILLCFSDISREGLNKLSVINFPKGDKENFLFPFLNHNAGESYIPIKDIHFSNSDMIIAGIENGISPSLLDKVDQLFEHRLSEECLWYSRFILNELMQNACDHSTSERYYLYAGIWNDNFQFGVCDMGVTIPAKLEQKYICPTDHDYLKKSLEFKVGTRRSRPGGLGLNHIFEILKGQDGRLVIVSRDGQMRRYFSRRQTELSKLKRPLAGTWCMARLPIKEEK
ncbi:MAG: hypothetical protein KAG61_01220 [Bacteriovoracaceae bacterium]|nr:hypothetical protein [Bacteriovoracaceae bacterium]